MGTGFRKLKRWSIGVSGRLLGGGPSHYRDYSHTVQIQGLRAGSGLVIATPGRLQDLMNRKFANLRHVKMLVLDEADRMLDMGFLPAIRRIVSALPLQRQTLCFSATLEQSAAGLVHDYYANCQPLRTKKSGSRCSRSSRHC